VKVKTFLVFALVCQLCVSSVWAGDAERTQPGFLLPWQVITEKFGDKALFCSRLCAEKPRKQTKECQDYALDPNTSFIRLPSEVIDTQKHTAVEPYLSRWQKDHWLDLPAVSVRLEPNGLSIEPGSLADGFYRLSLTSADKSNSAQNTVFYAVLAGYWKKDFFAFCRDCKEQIETNPDPQLIYSSIVVSHFDHLMELASKSSVLSKNTLESLTEAVNNRKTFEQGKCPNLVKGLNKIRLKRFEGSSIEEFVVFIPATYDGSKPEAVFLYPDNRRWAAGRNYSSRSGLIDIWWHTVSNKDINWKNYQYFLEILKQKLNIDEDRVYVNGECGNGLAAMSLALNFPDQWAECSMSLGNTYRHLAGNALNLPLIFVKGGHNEDHLVGYYDFAVECFKYHGCKYFKHSKPLSIAQARGMPVPVEQRNISPYRVSYTIESLANPKAYWIQIDGREDENFIASIDAIVWGQSILLKTKNIDAYNLDLDSAPVDANRPIEIIENGQSLGFAVDKVFSRKSEKYKDAVYIKSKHLHGPVWDVFTEPYVVIWGTGGENGQTKINERIAKSLAGKEPCIADVNLKDELINSHNLIFVGTEESNLWLSKIAKQLPVQVKQGRLIADGLSYEGPDLGVILIYPNPLNSEKYLAVFSGTSSQAMTNVFKAYSEIKSMRPADVGIFEVTDGGDIKWLILEKFNSVWAWHSRWNQVLTVVNKNHSEWQWRQWIAKTLREQLEVDVVVCEDLFRYEDSIPVGQITYRDLFNSFKNLWILKIKLDGMSLRKLLTVPFNDISKREVAVPIIDGVSLVKLGQDSGRAVLGINELENDRKYTIALPEKCINGERIGLVLKNYKITGEVYLVPLLKDYLYKNKKLDIDAELAVLKFGIF